jgi:hypothetical protein
MLRQVAQGNRNLNRLTGSMESFRQRKNYTNKPATASKGFVANIPNTSDVSFAVEDSLRTRGHGLSGTGMAGSGVPLKDIPPK